MRWRTGKKRVCPSLLSRIARNGRSRALAPWPTSIVRRTSGSIAHTAASSCIAPPKTKRKLCSGPKSRCPCPRRGIVPNSGIMAPIGSGANPTGSAPCMSRCWCAMPPATNTPSPSIKAAIPACAIDTGFSAGPSCAKPFLIPFSSPGCVSRDAKRPTRNR